MRVASCLVALVWCVANALAASRTTINGDHVLVIDGRKIFPLGFTLPPPPEGVTPDGKDAIGELAAAGANFLRTGAQAGNWDEPTMVREERYLDAAARHGMHCMPYLREYAFVNSDVQGEKLRQLVRRFKDHPGFGAWKGDDEPEWNKRPVDQLIRARDIIRQEDPDHPVVIIHAPRGTVESLRPYNITGDILGVDIYPIGYPPGMHSLLPNKTLSLVGDHARIIAATAEGKMPFWMVLQIAWSGVIKPGKTLRFPTFAEQRFMTYQSIIAGARGLIYFGGHLEVAMSDRDRKLGWNWTFWQRVLRPVIEEIGTHSPLYPALVAPDSSLPIACNAAGIDFIVRGAGDELFLLACKREGETAEVQFTGLPDWAKTAEVLHEAPRKVETKNGILADWFGPFEVHVYRFRR